MPLMHRSAEIVFWPSRFTYVTEGLLSESRLLSHIKYTARSFTMPIVYRTFVGSLSVYIFLDCAFKVRRHFSYKPLDANLLAECIFWGGV
jgi:hypothetical protein